MKTAIKNYLKGRTGKFVEPKASDPRQKKINKLIEKFEYDSESDDFSQMGLSERFNFLKSYIADITFQEIEFALYCITFKNEPVFKYVVEGLRKENLTYVGRMCP